MEDLQNSEFLDRDVDTIRIESVDSRDEALLRCQYLEPSVWFEGKDLNEVLESRELHQVSGRENVVVLLQELTPENRDSIPRVLDELLTDLWEHSRQLYILVLPPR